MRGIGRRAVDRHLFVVIAGACDLRRIARTIRKPMNTTAAR